MSGSFFIFFILISFGFTLISFCRSYCSFDNSEVVGEGRKPFDQPLLLRQVYRRILEGTGITDLFLEETCVHYGVLIIANQFYCKKGKEIIRTTFYMIKNVVKYF